MSIEQYLKNQTNDWTEKTIYSRLTDQISGLTVIKSMTL